MIYIFIVNYKEQTVHIYSFTFVQLYGFLIFLKGEYIQDWLYVPQSFVWFELHLKNCVYRFIFYYLFIYQKKKYITSTKVHGTRYPNTWHKIPANSTNTLVAISKSLKQKNK